MGEAIDRLIALSATHVSGYTKADGTKVSGYTRVDEKGHTILAVDRKTLDNIGGSEPMEAYGFHYAKDVFADPNSDLTGYYGFIQKDEDVPLDKIRYSNQPRVYHPHAERLSKIPGDQMDPAWAQRLKDGSVMLIEGHHRAAAARLRGDKTLRVRVTGRWN